MKTLHLNLKKKWFDMILSGEKTEEYRDITIYWFSRLFDYVACIPHSKRFDTITFSNGYSKNRPQFVIEFKGIEIREGNPEWGVVPWEKYFVLKLGSVIKTKNL